MFLSQSEIATWTRCPRKWFIEYYLGFAPADETPFGNRQLGIRVHTALEAHYGYGLSAVQVLQILYAIEIQAHPEFEQELKNEMALGLLMVSGYLEWVEAEGKDADLRVIATETDLQVPLPGLEKVILRARMDSVVQVLSTGVLKFIDHKTSASFEPQEALERNPQFRFYGLLQFLAAGHGVPVPGMELRPDRPVVMGGIMNTLRRVKRSGSSKPPYYQRAEVDFNLEVHASTLDRVRQVALEICNARGNLDATYLTGGQLEVVNSLQRTLLRPNPIDGDCDWRCPAAQGLCVAMDDGSDWPSILVSSGRYVRQDPYSRYADDPLRSIREKIASP
jgi:RecB family exonuclease